LHDPIISITTIISITIIIYFKKRGREKRKGDGSLDEARMPETEPAERTGSRAERSKRGRFAWEEKPKTENEDDYDAG
jgi:hypothetical protein